MALDRAEPGVEVDVETGGDLEPRVFEHIGAPAPAPVRDCLVTVAQQYRDLRLEQSDHGAEPAVQQRRGPGSPHLKTVEHPDHVVGSIPGLAGDPAVGREQANWLAVPI